LHDWLIVRFQEESWFTECGCRRGGLESFDFGLHDSELEGRDDFETADFGWNMFWTFRLIIDKHLTSNQKTVMTLCVSFLPLPDGGMGGAGCELRLS
jgi:hypothetical protein